MAECYSEGRIAKLTVLAMALILGSAQTSRADDALLEEIRRCATIPAPMERLACFDEAIGPPVSAAAKAPAPESATKAIEEAAPEKGRQPAVPPAREGSLDDLGAKPLLESDDANEELAIRARVTRCEKDARKKYYFVFDNGQVWKQVSDRRLSYKQCDFEVTITKDFFGYKMQPDGEKRRVSIARVK